jgi:hypothetical protein
MYDSWTITPELWIFKSENSVRVKFSQKQTKQQIKELQKFTIFKLK